MIPAAERPIGVFDSGLGGLTVLKEIMALLPGENLVYFGDSGRAPYGTKSPETVEKYSRQNIRFLLEQQVKMIVIACNTASACAYEAVKDSTGVPVVEVVSPGAKAAVQLTRNNRIGVIGTNGTVASEVYVRAIRRFADREIYIVQQPCPLFVGLAEEGWWENDIARSIAREYLAPLCQCQIDTLVLGCTHYPLLEKVIAETMGPQVKLVNAGSRVAAMVRQTLLDENLLNPGAKKAEHHFYTSDSVSHFQKLGGSFLAEEILDARKIDIEQY